MNYKIYQIDAFTDKIFSGNPAAVCPLNEWLNDELLQNIALENNLAETVFYVRNGNDYHIRWFTPTVEVDLCGHATLAAAYVLFNIEHYPEKILNFYSDRSGQLTVAKQDEFFTLNFPADISEKVDLSDELTSGFDISPIYAFKGRTDYMLVFENEIQIRDVKIDLNKISMIQGRGVIITAKGDKADFVSRFFAPQSGIDEDPVTGSAHTTLTPFWSNQLGKKELSAIQLSKRKGFLRCKDLGDRVEISGQGRLYMIGEIYTDTDKNSIGIAPAKTGWRPF